VTEADYTPRCSDSVLFRGRATRGQDLISGLCVLQAGQLKLDINENGAKRTETRLENFEPKTVLLRENRALGWRELLRLIPVFGPNELPSHVAG